MEGYGGEILDAVRNGLLIHMHRGRMGRGQVVNSPPANLKADKGQQQDPHRCLMVLWTGYPEMDVKDAAMVATINYVTDYVADQIVLIKGM